MKKPNWGGQKRSSLKLCGISKTQYLPKGVRGIQEVKRSPHRICPSEEGQVFWGGGIKFSEKERIPLQEILKMENRKGGVEGIKE